MVIASSYKFGSDALFVSQKLRENGLNSIIKDEPNETLPFQVLVHEGDLDTAIPIIEKLEIVESDLDPESEGYLVGHNEWNDKMYDPGHYTGGNIEHWIYNKDIWKYIAPIHLISGIGILGLVLLGFIDIDFDSILGITLYLFVGSSMLWQLKNRKRKK
ncbi:hypothetical protein CJ739_3938 [Mariniflexile rhizosphaerae]|uniref:hypothetical protein n=1 Tax=unclassified Mariniflexile TaxID=2643887 RepID=UPI000CC07DEF|nr:hypothetical protein [Mariniflexile sp. TRM1-10]AXP82996.1 hypothetical protein CJ739_3938 [Mariniflexile sp. TRM1-10]PLB19669.1 MAG: hypothetical protein TRG1_1449 [Flavobacteriaceae bacterium FS1-H7996/R]